MSTSVNGHWRGRYANDREGYRRERLNGEEMAKLPTPEDAARHILSIFMQQRRRPGEALGQHNFASGFSTGTFRSEDFKPGMKHAIDHGWIEKDPEDNYILTEAGFAEA
jgi:hypothetical protein